MESTENENSAPQPETNPPTPSPAPEPINQVQQPTSTPTARRPKTKLKVLLVILLLIAAGTAAYLLLKPEAKPKVVNKDIAVLRYGTDVNPVNVLYPNSANQALQVELNNQVFEGLVKYEGLTKLVPAIATGWSNPDTSTWVFDIRPNVTFHNGHPVTSASVKDSLDYILNHPELDNQAASTIKSVETVGQDKVKITTDGPDPVLLNKLAALYVFDTSVKKSGDPVSGSGPYTTKPGTAGSATNLKLAAYDKYYGGHISTRELDIISQPVDKLADSYKKGQVDLIAQPLEKSVLAKLNGYQAFGIPNTYVYFLGLNSAKDGSPLAKLPVRQAIDLALNRNELVAVNGNGQPINQLIPPTIPGYNPAITVPSQDTAKAKKLLADAGYPNGFTIQLTYSQANEAVVKKIISQLAGVGITATPNVPADEDAYYDTALGGKTDAFYIAYSSDYLDGADVLSSTLDTPNYQNKEILDAIGALSDETDGAARLKALQHISKQAADDVATVPILTPKETIVVRSDYQMKADVPNTLTGVYFYKVSRK